MKASELDIIKDAFDLPPEKAIEFLKKKGFKITWDWKEQIAVNHSRAFTVAKAMKMDVLQDTKDALDNALKNGDSFATFKTKLAPKLKARGWWGRQEVEGPDGAQVVQLGSPHRLETIYRTNMQSAYTKGRMEFFEDNKEDRPYLQFVAVLDNNTRPEHAKLNGIIRPVDDDFWNEHTPPLDYGCRCGVRAYTEEQAAQRGGVTGKIPEVKIGEGFGINPLKEQWMPVKRDYSPEIWKLGKSMKDETAP